MKISAILYGFFFAILFSFFDKPKFQVVFFALILLLLVAGEKIVERKYKKSSRIFPLAKAVICCLSFLVLCLLGLGGIYRPVGDVLVIFVFSMFSGLLVYFINRYPLRR